jgi:hypothetical protein
LFQAALQVAFAEPSIEAIALHCTFHAEPSTSLLTIAQGSCGKPLFVLGWTFCCVTISCVFVLGCFGCCFFGTGLLGIC